MTSEGNIPEWMQRSEGYLPPKSKDAFINKSILALFRLFAKFRSQDGGKQAGFGVNAFFKLPLHRRVLQRRHPRLDILLVYRYKSQNHHQPLQRVIGVIDRHIATASAMVSIRFFIFVTLQYHFCRYFSIRKGGMQAIISDYMG